ncbi:MAG: VCBS repeat-containing protein [Nitrospirae bacterium]|nr:VCBS repeat-containing protein [Nitrospirota bacterium]
MSPLERAATKHAFNVNLQPFNNIGLDNALSLCDGKADMLWQNTNSGDVYVWFMNGFNVIGGGYIARGVPNNWQLLTAADYNGDGKADLMWQDANTGGVYTWFMDGLKIADKGYVVNGMPSDWKAK